MITVHNNEQTIMRLLSEQLDLSHCCFYCSRSWGNNSSGPQEKTTQELIVEEFKVFDRWLTGLSWIADEHLGPFGETTEEQFSVFQQGMIEKSKKISAHCWMGTEISFIRKVGSACMLALILNKAELKSLRCSTHADLYNLIGQVASQEQCELFKHFLSSNDRAMLKELPLKMLRHIVLHQDLIRCSGDISVLDEIMTTWTFDEIMTVCEQDGNFCNEGTTPVMNLLKRRVLMQINVESSLEATLSLLKDNPDFQKQLSTLIDDLEFNRAKLIDFTKKFLDTIR